MEKKIVALDVSNLWAPYMNNTMVLCVNKYALQTIQDPEINAIFGKALNLSENIVQKIAAIFNQEQFPIPHAFTEEDVLLDAPRLFSDELWAVLFAPNVDTRIDFLFSWDHRFPQAGHSSILFRNVQGIL